MFKLLRNPCNIYIGLWCIYLLQGTLYSVGGVLSQGSLLIVLFMSLRHVVIIYMSEKKPLFFRGLELLFFMFTVYGLILFYTDGATTNGLQLRPSTSYYMKVYYMSLLPIFSCYFYTIKGYLTSNILKVWTIFFVAVAISQYYRMQREAMETMFTRDGEIVNNVGYIMLSIIPCILIYKKRLFQYILLMVCLLPILFSVKRGAIIIGVVLVLFHLFSTMKDIKGKQKFLFLSVVLGIGLLMIWYLKDTLFERSLFQERMENTLNGDSSGRDELYSALIDFYINNATILQQLVGVGADGTIKVASNYAHNDWLEILVNQGVMGLVVFIFYWLCLLRTAVFENLSVLSRRVLLMVMLYTFLQSIFSMSVGEFNIYVASIMGFALADGFKRDGYYGILDKHGVNNILLKNGG